MHIEYLAHSAFYLLSAKGTAILIDPYDPAIGYGAITRRCDALLISHEHHDHNYFPAVSGRTRVLRPQAASLTVNEVTVKGIMTDHDAFSGERRGINIVYCLTMDGIRVCHLGDLGHILTDEQVREIGPVDVLLIPVGGHHTIDGKAAKEVTSQLAPKIVIPMHYRTGQLKRDEFPLDEVAGFTENQPSVEKSPSSLLEMTPESLPKAMKIVVLNYTF
ncbi:MAG: MBL fold metallo-hydrolase [Candidatus Eremiobacteraeota bacterium]|nr:MBL fold metallo-hydrolase [Candidatus Eremiobacteraeota bacterium]